MSEVRFDGRVAIVTGAGGGLGRSHALMLAARGAKVVVNDLGGSVEGRGSDESSARQVVREIEENGGEAVASFAGVDTAEGANAIVQTALESFGRIDIVINNAGILRDVTFHKMTDEDWDAVLRVHLYGTMHVTKAAWSHMRDAKYGRVVTTTSAAGLYGNFGQANYAAAKLGIVGLTKTLAHEGAKYDIRVNAIAPVARSRMTETILDAATLEKLEPSLVTPVVAYLASEGCADSGQIYAVGGGYVSRVAVVEGRGTFFATGELTPEQVAASWDQINDLDAAVPYQNAMEAVQVALAKATGKA